MSTPQSLVDWAVRRYKLELDVCASEWNAKLPRYYSLDRGEDGLHLPWDVPVWCNPPWANVEPWLVRGLHAIVDGECPLVVYCLPYRPSVSWWYSWVERPMASISVNLHTFEGRINYDATPGKDKKNGGFEPTVLVVYERRLRAADFNRC